MKWHNIFSNIHVKQIVILFVLVISITVSVILFLNKSLPQPKHHVWSTYENKDFGFSLSYPSDIVRPYKAAQNTNTLTGFPGADTFQFLDEENRKVIFLWVQDTHTTTAQEWFAATGMAAGSRIAGVCTFAGVNAIHTQEYPLKRPADDRNLHFVHKGKAYSFYVHGDVLLPEDITYIFQSFRFREQGSVLQILLQKLTGRQNKEVEKCMAITTMQLPEE